MTADVFTESFGRDMTSFRMLRNSSDGATGAEVSMEGGVPYREDSDGLRHQANREISHTVGTYLMGWSTVGSKTELQYLRKWQRPTPRNLEFYLPVFQSAERHKIILF